MPKRPKAPETPVPPNAGPTLAVLAHNLKLWMEEKGIGQKRAAVDAGLNDTYVRDIIRGNSQNPTLFKLLSVCGVLGCSLSDLLSDASDQVNALLRVSRSLSPDNQKEVLAYATKLKRLEDLETAGQQKKT
jgi:transcriptional regulator with XRE-family HTH domain